MKKYICLLMAVVLCALAVSCAGAGDSETTTGTTQTTASSTSDTTESTSTAGTSTTSIPDVPVVPEAPADAVSVKVGNYVTVIYNPDYCELETSVQSGVGSKENITLTVKMKNGYIFNGWSKNNAIVNGAELTGADETLTLSESSETTVYVNYSVTLIYHSNGGTFNGGNDTYGNTYSVVMYKCPNTLPEHGYFSRAGYTLLEYNTKADGTGEAVSLGSRISTGGKSSLDLYCIWEEQTPASDFDYTVASNGRVKITKYKGALNNVVIPDDIDGNPVYSIGDGAFEGSAVKRVVLSKNVVTVEKNAFAYSDLETLVIFDSLISVSGESFTGSVVKNLRVNAALDLYDSWMTSVANNKVDRVLWAKDMKKLIIFGGSGSLYGFDCEAIDEALENEYVVINLGSNANLSAAFYFEFLEKMTNEDDIILWSPEMGSYMIGAPTFSNRTWEFNAGHYDILRYVDISQYRNVFDYYANYAKAHQTAQKPWDNFSNSVSLYGDSLEARSHQEAVYDYEGSFRGVDRAFGNSTDHMREIVARIVDNGVKIYYSFAAMDENGTGISDEIIKGFTDKFTAAFPGIDIISEYKDCLVKSEYMWNSAWHTTIEGAKERTKTVIRDILAQLAKEGK